MLKKSFNAKPFFMFSKRQFCPVCGNKLEVKKEHLYDEQVSNEMDYFGSSSIGVNGRTRTEYTLECRFCEQKMEMKNQSKVS